MAFLPTNRPTIAYLGPRSDQRYVLKLLMTKVGLPLTCLDDSFAAGVYMRRGTIGSVINRIARANAQIRGRANSTYMDRMISAVDAAGVQCVVAYWGINPLADAIALKKRRPELKVVLNVLCHPLALTPLRIMFQNRLMRRAAKWLDGFVFPSRAMQSYFEQNILSEPRPSVIVPPCLPAEAQSSDPIPDCELSPNLVFLGRMEWSDAQPTDKVGQILDGLLDSGVHVFHHATREPLVKHDCRHTFEYLSLEKITRFCTQFQATLVAYNTAACASDIRFRLTVPDRLVAGVAAGLPVFLPKVGYDACWDYLSGYPAALAYDCPQDVRRELDDRQRMRDLRLAARDARRSYTAESHLDKMLDFLSSLTADRHSAVQSLYLA